MSRVVLLALAAFILVGCKQGHKKTFIQLSEMDTTVRAQDDFYRYVNGAWVDSTEIPESEARWGSFNILNDKAATDINTLIKELTEGKRYKKGSPEQLIADLFRSGMDSVFIDQLGLAPLHNELAAIDSIQGRNEIVPLICHQIRSGLVPLRYGIVPYYVFTFYVYQDAKESDRQVAHFEQGKLGLPTKDYYFKNDSSSVGIRDSYVEYLSRILFLSGADSAKAANQAVRILELETKLAEASRAPVELRDPELNYNKLSIAELDSLAPQIKWEQVIANLGIETDTVIVGQPDYFKALSKLLYSEPLDDWKAMLRFRLIHSNTGMLSSDFNEASFDFYGRTLYGMKEMKPRWKRISKTVDTELRDALGQLYVKQYFPPEAKERMDKLVDNLLIAYEARIQQASWMSDSTKLKALDKLHSITRKIGYPNKWDQYKGFEISHNDFAGNLHATRKYTYNKMIGNLDQPVDPETWLMTPATVNAYYSPTNNEIVFPAGILQPPFFNFKADDAINYGAIGVVIGHEVTHGFDDKGRKFDADGNLNEWWTDEDSERFDKQASTIVSQFSEFEVLDGVHVNGELTQGENIADLGGILIAYDAFKRTEQGQSKELIDGFTPDQRFFLSYAKIWKEKITDEFLRQQVLTDPHSPAYLRVNGALPNVPEFIKAFNVQPGDALYQHDSLQVVIW